MIPTDIKSVTGPIDIKLTSNIFCRTQNYNSNCQRSGVSTLVGTNTYSRQSSETAPNRMQRILYTIFSRLRKVVNRHRKYRPRQHPRPTPHNLNLQILGPNGPTEAGAHTRKSMDRFLNRQLRCISIPRPTARKSKKLDSRFSDPRSRRINSTLTYPFHPVSVEKARQLYEDLETREYYI